MATKHLTTQKNSPQKTNEYPLKLDEHWKIKVFVFKFRPFGPLFRGTCEILGWVGCNGWLEGMQKWIR